MTLSVCVLHHGDESASSFLYCCGGVMNNILGAATNAFLCFITFAITPLFHFIQIFVVITETNT